MYCTLMNLHEHWDLILIYSFIIAQGDVISVSDYFPCSENKLGNTDGIAQLL